MPLATWLDAVHAILATTPAKELDELLKQLITAGAKAAPDRDTWGLLPEHQYVATLT